MDDGRQSGILALEPRLDAVAARRLRLLALISGLAAILLVFKVGSHQLTLILRRLQLKHPLLLLVCPRLSSRGLEGRGPVPVALAGPARGSANAEDAEDAEDGSSSFPGGGETAASDPSEWGDDRGGVEWDAELSSAR